MSECPVSGNYCDSGIVDGEQHGWWYCSCPRGKEREEGDRKKKAGEPPPKSEATNPTSDKMLVAADEVTRTVSVPPIAEAFDAKTVAVPRNSWLSALAVACMYKHDHPADDGEPTDANWLMAVGFSKRDDSVKPYFAIPANGQWLQVWEGRAFLECKYVGDWQLPGRYPTRGHVRRLCAALGVPLTEKP